VVFPGAGFVELVIRAADEVGAAVIDELVLAAPPGLTGGAAVAVQGVVGCVGPVGCPGVCVRSAAGGWGAASGG